MSAHPRGSANGNRHSPTGREMLTFSGHMVPLAALKPEHIHLKDIAWGLGGYRFGNQHPVRITIAQHSLACHALVRAWFPLAPADSPLLRAALLHDANEAYTQDLIGAVKLLIREEEFGWACGQTPYDGFSSSFDELGDSIQAAIEERFDCAVPAWMRQVVSRADKAACAYELAIGGWAPVQPSPLACELFDALGSPYDALWGGCDSFERAAREAGCA